MYEASLHISLSMSIISVYSVQVFYLFISYAFHRIRSEKFNHFRYDICSIKTESLIAMFPHRRFPITIKSGLVECALVPFFIIVVHAYICYCFPLINSSLFVLTGYRAKEILLQFLARTLPRRSVGGSPESTP